MFFDDTNIYVSARCWDSHPERMVANEMRRDTNQLRQNDTFAVPFDTYHDRRNVTCSTPTRSAALPTARSPMRTRRTSTGTRLGS